MTFDDGLSGGLDLSDKIERGPIFAPPRDEPFFTTVAVGAYGHTFDWNLDDMRHESDFCWDATRTDIGTARVAALADRYEPARTAAE